MAPLAAQPGVPLGEALRRALDEALSGELAAVVEAGDFAGKLGEVITLYGRGRVSARRVMVVGLGPREAFGVEEARRAAASAASAWSHNSSAPMRFAGRVDSLTSTSLKPKSA